MMMSIVNSWIIYTDNKRTKMTMIAFLTEIAESLISHGQDISNRKRKNQVKPNMKRKKSVHYMKKGQQRRRCSLCAKSKIEKRTTYYCEACDPEVPLCMPCFEPYHTKKSM